MKRLSQNKKELLYTFSNTYLHDWKNILFVFILSRIIFFVIMAIGNQSISSITILFDNEHYLFLANNGYIASHEYEHLTAFFPLIPLLIRFCGKYGMLFINELAFCGSVIILNYHITKKNISLKENTTLLTLLFFAISPIGFFSFMYYTETLFVFFTMLTFHLFEKRKFGLGLGIVIGLGTMTRSFGAMLFFAIFIGMVYLWIKKETTIFKIFATYIPATIISCLYPAFLQMRYGNWKLFVDCQYTYWTKEKTNLFQLIPLQLKIIFTNKITQTTIYKINEIATLFLFSLIIISLLNYMVLKKKQNKININDIVLALYVLFSIYCLNTTIRETKWNTPTTSFFRYYYGMFPLYLFFDSFSKNKKRVLLLISILFTLIASRIFCMDIFFY